jgi:hypothetical protein
MVGYILARGNTVGDIEMYELHRQLHNGDDPIHHVNILQGYLNTQQGQQIFVCGTVGEPVMIAVVVTICTTTTAATTATGITVIIVWPG